MQQTKRVGTVAHVAYISNGVEHASAVQYGITDCACGGILCSAGRERGGLTWRLNRAGRAKLSTLGCEQLFSTPGSQISPPGRADQNVCRVCSLQRWICRHCAVDDMSGVNAKTVPGIHRFHPSRENSSSAKTVLPHISCIYEVLCIRLQRPGGS